MSAFTAQDSRRVRLPEGSTPALVVLALGVAILCLRPGLPIDETRYLEVFREHLEGNPLLLRLLGEPYAEKPPLLFWIARALTWLALPPELALRCVPVLASALTVVLAARVGARAGLSLVGWFQAALWIPWLAGQFLIFDPLLALGVWGSVDAWVRGRDGRAMVWSAVALLAKGPVAVLFLVAFFWGTLPLRSARSGAGRRAGLVLALALVPLAAWALSAAVLGGPGFARALLFERWAGRVVTSHDHARAITFYLPVALLGSLPGTPILFRRGSRSEPEWSARLAKALLALLAVFSLMSGKQAHYLVPAGPGLALFLAGRVETDPRALARLRYGVRAELALFLCLAVSGFLALPRMVDSFGTRGRELVEHGTWWLPLGLASLAFLGGLALAFRRGLSAKALLEVALVSSGAGVLPLHYLAGELLFPHALADALRSRPRELALLGTSQHGLYALLASSIEIEKLHDEDELASWSADHPDGWLLLDPQHLEKELPGVLVPVTRDEVHRFSVLVLRRGSDP